MVTPKKQNWIYYGNKSLIEFSTLNIHVSVFYVSVFYVSSFYITVKFFLLETRKISLKGPAKAIISIHI